MELYGWKNLQNIEKSKGTFNFIYTNKFEIKKILESKILLERIIFTVPEQYVLIFTNTVFI